MCMHVMDVYVMMMCRDVCMMTVLANTISIKGTYRPPTAPPPSPMCPTEEKRLHLYVTADTQTKFGKYYYFEFFFVFGVLF